MMTREERRSASRQALEDAEGRGEVADSTAVRIELMEQVTRGEITIAESQHLLKKIKRGAKRAGQLTRSQAYAGKRLPKEK